MIDTLLRLALTVGGAAIVAYTATTIIVAVADAFGLVYSARREAVRHRDDPMEPTPERRLVPVWHLDLDSAAIRAALVAQPPSPTPIADRIAVARRLALIA